MKTVDVAILGAGAAGMMCAVEAGRRGRSVLVIDHAAAPGEKIRISGGGRCNFTNLSAPPERFLSQNPRFAVSALRRFAPRDFIARVDAAGIAWHEKTLGQLFCDGSARQIVAMLTGQMAEAGVELWLGTSVEAVERGDGFDLRTSRGMVRARSLVLATGGKSIPKMGATGLAYQIAAEFGLGVTETRPALVPLTFAAQELEALTPLAGIAVPARVRAGKIAFEEGFLFTHRGLSGPSVLQISSYWREGQAISVDLLPHASSGAALKALRASTGRVSVLRALSGLLPEKLARHAVQRAGADATARLADLSNAALEGIASAIHAWTVKPVGTEGYRTAEVTLGGVDTKDLSSQTMEARTCPGLFVIGEAVDVTGWLGGYNFQWAWSSGWAAGQAV
jgi:predicted Rossmann fold flavoprotein